MSSLLEQAIVDASALKEAALKNAENSVLEKYSQEVRGVLDTLLEQEAPEDPGAFLEEVDLAYAGPEISGPEEDEEIEIDLDNIRLGLGLDMPQPEDLIDSEEAAQEIFGGAPGGPPPEMGLPPEGAPAAPEMGTPPDMGGMGGMGELAENIEVSDELIEALAEELAVDVTARLAGWSPLASAITPNAAEETALEEEAAEAQSEEVTEKNDQYLKLYESQMSALRLEIGDLRSLLGEAKDHLNVLILENAKLLFQNKALNSASLNERQKEKIVEAVRNASSVEETKMLFESLQSAVGGRSVHRTESLREAVSRPTTSMLLNSNRSDPSTTVADPTMDRMLRLAGLKQ